MNIQRQIDELLTLRASQWVDILRAGRPQDLAEFVKWVGESPRNLDEFLTMAALDQALEGTNIYSQFDRSDVLSKISVPSIERQLHAPKPVDRDRGRLRLGWLTALVAGSCAIAVAIVAWQRWADYSYVTQIGEQRSFDLPDGSVMHLNAQSRVKVRFDDHQRELLLLDGEALFKVAHDPHRRFEVRTPQAAVEALGTEFNVLSRPEAGTRVAVLEGRVQIATAERAPESPKVLGGGEEAEVAWTGPIEVKSHADVASAVAWRQRRLVFSQAPLEEIVRQFNRFTRKRLRLEAIPALSFHYSGTFDADDPEALIVYLSKEPDLKIEVRDQEIVIRGLRRPAPTAGTSTHLDAGREP